MKRQETIPIPWVSLLAKDLDAIAARMTAAHTVKEDASIAAYDRDTKAGLQAKQRAVVLAGRQTKAYKKVLDLHPDGEDEAERFAEVVEQEAKRKQEADGYEDARRTTRQPSVDRDLQFHRPQFAIATKLSSFEDSDWPGLWSRVSKSDVRSISMRSRAQGGTVDLQIEIVGRRTANGSNRVNLSFTDSAAFDTEFGRFTDLFRTREATTRRRLAAGPVGGLLWKVLPSFVVSSLVVVGYSVVAGVRPAHGVLLGASLAWTLFVLLFSSIPSDYLLDRIAPRVSIEGTGPYVQQRNALTQVALALMATAVFEIFLLIGPVLAA